MTGQLEMLPSSPPATRRATLALAELHGYEHAHPSPQLVESIRRLGVLQPILVAGNPGGGYRLIDGRRRVKAIEQLAEQGHLAERLEIRAEIIEATDLHASPRHAGITLALHGTRSPSPACELEAIEAILRHHEDEQTTVSQIAQATGMPVATIRKRLRLRNLSAALRERFERGELTVTVAEAATKLGEQQQRELEAVLDSEQRITLAKVQEIARRRTLEAAATLDDELFTDHNAPSWRATVRGHLQAALDALPAAEQDAELAHAIRGALHQAEAARDLTGTAPAGG